MDLNDSNTTLEYFPFLIFDNCSKITSKSTPLLNRREINLPIISYISLPLDKNTSVTSSLSSNDKVIYNVPSSILIFLVTLFKVSFLGFGTILFFSFKNIKLNCDGIEILFSSVLVSFFTSFFSSFLEFVFNT
jgi:hypothetical protein